MVLSSDMKTIPRSTVQYGACPGIIIVMAGLCGEAEFMPGAIVRKFFVLFLFVLIIALPGVLYAKSYYVAPNGDDGNPGTIEAPFASVNKAHDNGNLHSRET